MGWTVVVGMVLGHLLVGVGLQLLVGLGHLDHRLVEFLHGPGLLDVWGERQDLRLQAYVDGQPRVAVRISQRLQGG